MSDWTPEFVAAYKRLEAQLAAERGKVQELQEKLRELCDGRQQRAQPISQKTDA